GLCLLSPRGAPPPLHSFPTRRSSDLDELRVLAKITIVARRTHLADANADGLLEAPSDALGITHRALLRAGDFLGRVRNAEGAHRAELRLGAIEVHAMLREVGVGGHRRAGRDLARIEHVLVMPDVVITTADALKVRTDSA